MLPLTAHYAEPPLISVVIPTHNRQQGIGNAIDSVLAQTYSPVEVVVVVDGPDPESERILESYREDRLRSIVLPQNVGGAEARNIGVRAARGEWIAFLDDDDEWLPEKLAKQIKLAEKTNVFHPVISCQLLVVDSESARVLPRTTYRMGQDVSEYLFCRRGFAYGDGMLQTSTLLARRPLWLEEPFQKGLTQHQDWDWLIRVARRPDVAIQMLPEALVRMKAESSGNNVSRKANWQQSLAWARANRERMTGSAFAFFIATECVPRARRQGSAFIDILRLLLESIRLGRPRLRQVFLFFFFWLVPEKQRRDLRNRTMRKPFMTVGGAFR